MNLGSWSDRRIFVTGGTGFLGSWLVKELAQRGAYVVTLVPDWDPRSACTHSGAAQCTYVVHGVLQDYATLERAIRQHKVDTVFHLGAQTIVGTALHSPLATFETNIRGTYNLLEACRVHAKLIRCVVVASSDKAYGEAATLPYTEDMPLLGRNPYDVSKSCADLLARAYYETYGTPVVVARFGNIFGGGDFNWSRLVPGTIRALYYGQRPVIRSNGQYTRDYLYVLDAVAACLLTAAAIGRPGIAGQAFNFGSEHPHTVLEIVGILQNLMGRSLEPLILDETEAEIRNQYVSSEKARRMLGWQPMYDLETSLKLTVQWYERFFEEAEGTLLKHDIRRYPPRGGGTPPGEPCTRQVPPRWLPQHT